MIITLDISQIVYKTGVSRFVREMTRHLLKMDKENQYKLFAGVFRQRGEFEKFFQELDSENLAYTPYVKLFPPQVASFIWNDLHILNIENFVGKTDIVHTSDWAQSPTKGKLVTTIHDLTPVLFGEHHTPSLVKNFKKQLQIVRQEASAVTVVSESTKNDLVKYWEAENSNQEIPPITIVHNAAKENFTRVTDPKKLEEVKRKYKIDKPFFLSVGTMEPRKNLTRICASFVQAKLGNVDLLIAGKIGWGAQVSHDDLGENIRLLGFVEDDDLPALYSLALALVYPSFYEGFGLPVLEAMQCGCPVITSNLSSLPEVVGEVGILVDPYSINEIAAGMNVVLKNSQGEFPFLHQKDLVAQAKKFSWEKSAMKMVEVYKKIFEKP